MLIYKDIEDGRIGARALRKRYDKTMRILASDDFYVVRHPLYDAQNFFDLPGTKMVAYSETDLKKRIASHFAHSEHHLA